ncbi:MAG: hypothetical protein J2P31_06240 [Blastocatellia bacterium]|nr:hypothetical protein [Blastocatellia bacterium]
MRLFTLSANLVAAIFVISLLLAATCGANTVSAQDQSAADAILLEKLKADKKLMVADRMELSDDEARGFWPIYDSYQKDLHFLDIRLMKTIQDYADAYNNNNLTDKLAVQLSEELIAIEEDEAKLRKAYLLKLVGVLPGRMAARYLQIENNLRALLRYELADGIPLMGSN